MEGKRLEEILSFLKEIDKLKSVMRNHYLVDFSKKESDTDHTWHMCMVLLTIYDDLETEADLGHTIKLILVHDLVEVYTDDAFAYDEEARKGKEERERKAAHQIFSLLPEDQRQKMYGYWDEYELGKTPASKLAKGADRTQALLQNVFTDGIVWKEKGITREQIYARNQEVMDSDPVLRQIIEHLYKKAEEGGFLPD